MLEEVTKALKPILIAVIFLSLFKIYETGGFNNPVTTAVVLIVASLWIYFRLELNEEVQEMQANEEDNNKEKLDKIIYTPPLSPYNQHSTSSSVVGVTGANTVIPTSDPKRRPLRMTKICRLIRSKSKSPLKKYDKLDKLLRNVNK